MTVFVSEKTRITVPPKSRKVNTGSRIDLRCEARADPELQLRYSWKKDDADLVYDEKIEWRPSQNVLTISDMTAYDAAIYTCVAYTPEPKRSEDQASATVAIKGIVIHGAPYYLISDWPETYCKHSNQRL